MADEDRRHLVADLIACLDKIYFHETARTLEKESGYFFNLDYFERCFLEGELEEAKDYLSGFLPGIHDNIYSVNVYFELNWQKLMEALDEGKRPEAQTIVEEDLRPFERYHPNLIACAAELASLEDFRTHEAFEYYEILGHSRLDRLDILRTNLEENPLLMGKIRYPPVTPPATPPHQG